MQALSFFCWWESDGGEVFEKGKKIWLLPSCSPWSWPPDLMPGQVGEARMIPKLGCRTGRWSKNEPRFRCRAGRWCKNDPQIWLPSCREGENDPQIWCSGWLEGENDPPNLMLGVVGRVKRPPDLNWWLNAHSKIDLSINEFSFGSSFEGGNLFDDLHLLRRIGVR